MTDCKTTTGIYIDFYTVNFFKLLLTLFLQHLMKGKKKKLLGTIRLLKKKSGRMIEFISELMIFHWHSSGLFKIHCH